MFARRPSRVLFAAIVALASSARATLLGLTACCEPFATSNSLVELDMSGENLSINRTISSSQLNRTHLLDPMTNGLSLAITPDGGRAYAIGYNCPSDDKYGNFKCQAFNNNSNFSLFGISLKDGMVTDWDAAAVGQRRRHHTSCACT